MDHAQDESVNWRERMRAPENRTSARSIKRKSRRSGRETKGVKGKKDERMRGGKHVRDEETAKTKRKKCLFLLGAVVSTQVRKVIVGMNLAEPRSHAET